jgi:WD40 repeat protein
MISVDQIGARAVAYDADGPRIVTGGMDSSARVWDATTGKPICEPIRLGSQLQSVAIRPQGDVIVTGCDDATARFWNAENRNAIGEPMRHGGAVVAVAFSPKGDRLLTGAADNRARLWDVASCKPLCDPIEHDGWVTAVAFSPAGDRFVSASGTSARIGNATNGAAIGERLQIESGIGAVVFSADGKYVLTACGDKTVRVWDAVTLKPVGEPMRHAAEVVSAAFSPTDNYVVTASLDHHAQLWDGLTGVQMGESMWHEELGFVAFSQDGDSVITASIPNFNRGLVENYKSLVLPQVQNIFQVKVCGWSIMKPPMPADVDAWVTLSTGYKVDGDGVAVALTSADWSALYDSVRSRNPQWPDERKAWHELVQRRYHWLALYSAINSRDLFASESHYALLKKLNTDTSAFDEAMAHVRRDAKSDAEEIAPDKSTRE